MTPDGMNLRTRPPSVLIILRNSCLSETFTRWPHFSIWRLITRSGGADTVQLHFAPLGQWRPITMHAWRYSVLAHQVTRNMTPGCFGVRSFTKNMGGQL